VRIRDRAYLLAVAVHGPVAVDAQVVKVAVAGVAVAGF
jgi:hypothetical protein